MVRALVRVRAWFKACRNIVRELYITVVSLGVSGCGPPSHKGVDVRVLHRSETSSEGIVDTQ